MKKIGIALVIFIVLIGFVAAIGISPTGYTTNNNSETDEEKAETKVQNSEENNSKEDDKTEEELNDKDKTESQDDCEEWSCTKWNDCSKNMKTRDCVQMNTSCPGKQEMPKLTKKCEEKERLRFNERATECPEDCACAGSTIKCQLVSGREMTILAGKSGNMIIQVKGINATTDVTLYKSEDGKIYAVSKDNETKIIKMLPDQVRERIRERIEAKFQNEGITLDENGTYQYRAEKKARLFFLFQVNVPIQAEVNSETGEVLKIKNPWWSFLAKDDIEEQVVGASCGTVTPGYNDECCQNKGYDSWDGTASECKFNSSQ